MSTIINVWIVAVWSVITDIYRGLLVGTYTLDTCNKFFLNLSNNSLLFIYLFISRSRGIIVYFGNEIPVQLSGSNEIIFTGASRL